MKQLISSACFAVAVGICLVGSTNSSDSLSPSDEPEVKKPTNDERPRDGAQGLADSGGDQSKPASDQVEPVSDGEGDRACREVWVALREDGKPGTGSVTDPYDASSVEKLNSLFERFHKELGESTRLVFDGLTLLSSDKPTTVAWDAIRAVGRITSGSPTSLSIHCPQRPSGLVLGGESVDVDYDSTIHKLRVEVAAGRHDIIATGVEEHERGPRNR